MNLPFDVRAITVRDGEVLVAGWNRADHDALDALAGGNGVVGRLLAAADTVAGTVDTVELIEAIEIAAHLLGAEPQDRLVPKPSDTVTRLLDLVEGSAAA